MQECRDVELRLKFIHVQSSGTRFVGTIVNRANEPRKLRPLVLLATVCKIVVRIDNPMHTYRDLAPDTRICVQYSNMTTPWVLRAASRVVARFQSLHASGQTRRPSRRPAAACTAPLEVLYSVNDMDPRGLCTKVRRRQRRDRVRRRRKGASRRRAPMTHALRPHSANAECRMPRFYFRLSLYRCSLWTTSTAPRPCPFTTFPELEDPLADLRQLLFDRLGERGLHDHAIPDPHVEDPPHFLFRNVPLRLKEREDPRPGPRIAIHRRISKLGGSAGTSSPGCRSP